jgi:hypothetical protein
MWQFLIDSVCPPDEDEVEMPAVLEFVIPVVNTF